MKHLINFVIRILLRRVHVLLKHREKTRDYACMINVSQAIIDLTIKLCSMQSISVESKLKVGEVSLN